MKIGILQTAYKKASEYGAFYNVQELGLARALASNGIDVVLYKAVDGEDSTIEEYEGKLTIKLVGVRYIGINGLFDVEKLDRSIDVLVYFCDTQIVVPKVYKWCNDNKVTFLPYIGVIHSHSESFIKRLIMGIAARKNLAVYKKCQVLAKTPAMKKELENIGCNKVTIFPVGLDETVMTGSSDYGTNGDIGERIHKCVEHILYVGRMEEEKQPLMMLDIYDELLKHSKNLKLTMIGDGYLYNDAKARLDEIISTNNLSKDQAVIIKKVAYKDMPEFYKKADIYVNLNKVEILGMSILEAMYYGSLVVAIDAPGPRYILDYDAFGPKYGIVAQSQEEVISAMKDVILEGDNYNISDFTKNARERVVNKFVWSNLAKNLVEML